MEIYLDNAASSKTDSRVAEAMLPYMLTEYANPSSGHSFGSRAMRAVDMARKVCADAIGCEEDEIIFTSGGTEANNLFLRGIPPENGKHIITTAVEHHSVLNVCEQLATAGIKTDQIGVDNDGKLDVSEIEKILSPNTALVSVMYANNELGNIYPVKKIGDLAKKHGIMLHTDCVAAFMKSEINVASENISAMSVSAHKFHGPKGCGFLYLKRGSRLHAQITGGGQENGLRAGTLNVAGIVGMAKAITLAREYGIDKIAEEEARLKYMMTERILKDVKGSYVNGDIENSLPCIVNYTFEGINSSALVMHCSKMGLMVSSGSACAAGEDSHVISAMKKYPPGFGASLRVSFSRYTTQTEIVSACDIIERAVEMLRKKR